VGGKVTTDQKVTLDTQGVFESELIKQNKEDLAIFTKVPLVVEPRQEVKRLRKPPIRALGAKRGSQQSLHAQV
jgi:hypothetical protein